MVSRAAALRFGVCHGTQQQSAAGAAVREARQRSEIQCPAAACAPRSNCSLCHPFPTVFGGGVWGWGGRGGSGGATRKQIWGGEVDLGMD